MELQCTICQRFHARICEKSPQKFQRNKPLTPQLSPHQWNRPQFGTRIQLTATPDTSPKLDKKGTKDVQSIVGSFLYFGRAIDSTMLVALNEIAAYQSSPMQFISSKCNQLLDYVATFLNAKLHFTASNMILHVDSDTAYLVQDRAHRRIAGHYILSSHPTLAPQIPHKTPNAPILVKCKTLQHVVALTAEAENGGGLFNNAQTILHV